MPIPDIVPPVTEPQRIRALATLTHVSTAAIVYEFQNVRYVRAVHAPAGRVALLREHDGIPLVAWDGDPPTAGVIQSLIRAGRMRRHLDVDWFDARPSWILQHGEGAIVTQKVLVCSPVSASGASAAGYRRRRVRAASRRRS